MTGSAESLVPIAGETIRLGQFLKLADVVDAGADAQALLATREVTVNGETETRRGRTLVRGDVVRVAADRGAGAAGGAFRVG